MDSRIGASTAFGITQPEFNELLKNERKPLINKFLAGQYPPGSVLKPIIALAALENKIVDQDYTHFCSGKIELYGQEFYNENTEKFLAVYGDIIQAFRTLNITDYLSYTIKSAGILPGMKVLDAGCGVCGPAIYFAENILDIQIDACTISDVQFNMAKKITLNAKMRNTSICGAAETLLIDKACVKTHLKPILQLLSISGCKIIGDQITNDDRFIPCHN